MTKSSKASKIIEPPVPDLLEPLCEGDGPWRPNVAALILRKGGTEILMGERVDTPGAWQWPQGGLDPGEEAEVGLRREMKEEIGTDNFTILHRFPFLLRYRFPKRLGKKFKPRVGQEQIYYIVELHEEPDLAKAEHEEFGALCWKPLDQALDSPIWFKREVYKAALQYAREIATELNFAQ